MSAAKFVKARAARSPPKAAPPAAGKPTPPAPSGETRSAFGSRIGFIMAAIGSAIGFGSIARFPTNVFNNGGAAFVLVYAGLMVLVGIPMMIAEFSLGRSAQKNVVGAWPVLTGEPKTRWRFAGILYVLVAVFFLSWYSSAAGWTLRYIFATLTGAYFDDPTGYFADTAEGPDTLFWHFAVMGLTLGAVVGQVSKGIEKVNLVMMPALFVIILVLTGYAATLSDIADGYVQYLNPDFSKITVAVVSAAIGQAFFSLSLGQGAMMTYASYISKTTSLAQNATIISMGTLAFAFTCGLMIFPMLSSFGLLDTGQAGLGLIFGPLSLVFSEMGQPVGNIVGTLFFVAVFFAAFTSAVSLAEPGIAYLVEEHHIDRRRSAILVCGVIYAVGIIAALSQPTLNFESGKITDMFVILGGLLIALYAGWFSPQAAARTRMDECESGWRLSKFVYPIVRYAMPAILGLLLFFSFLGTPCVLSGDAPDAGLFETFFGADLIGCQG